MVFLFFKMSRLGFKSVVYHGDVRLGELDIVPVSDTNFQFPNNEIRIHHISPTSERCIPLSVLHTISSFPVRCKLESFSPAEQPLLIHLHASCFYEFKVYSISSVLVITFQCLNVINCCCFFHFALFRRRWLLLEMRSFT